MQKFVSKLFKCILLWLIEVTIEMHEVIFVVRAGVVFGRYITVFDSSWNEVAGKKRILACHRESTRPLDSPFPSRLVTVTPVFLRFRGEYEITLIEYRHTWALKTH